MNQQIQVQITTEDVLSTLKKITGKQEDFAPTERAIVDLILMTQQAIQITIMEKQQTASILQGINGGKLK